jgi:hypothetical protein
MRFFVLFLILVSASLAHLGEAQEQHSPLDILLDSPSAIIVSFVIFLAVSYVFYTLFPMKEGHRNKFLLLTGLVAAVFMILIFLSLTKEPSSPVQYHTHADFRVFLNGTHLDFTNEKYMSSKNNSINSRVHLHDMDGDVIHHHAKNVTMADFFITLNMAFNSTCFVTDEALSFCNDGKKLRMFVMHANGTWKEEPEMERYVFEDLDRILITYGNPEDPISDQLSSVTDKACIQSEKCPERGKPSDESTCSGKVCNV